MDRIERTALSFSRDLEFASEPELARRMGLGRELWLAAAVKELIDNALDACEEASIEPEIAVEIDDDFVVVSDNGPGMPPELVEQLCIRSERTSAREAYAAPDRGAMGNALQTLMALGLADGAEFDDLDHQPRRRAQDHAAGEQARRPDRSRAHRAEGSRGTGHRGCTAATAPWWSAGRKRPGDGLRTGLPPFVALLAQAVALPWD